MAGYFSFHYMVSTTIVKLIYVMGLLALAGLGFIQIALGVFALIQQSRTDLPALPLLTQPMTAIVLIATGLLTLIPANFIWRLVCEAWILVFSMHELLASIDEKLSNRNPSVS